MSQNLLEENSHLKRKLHDFEEQSGAVNELINPLVLQNISTMDNSLRRKINLTFKKGDAEKRVIALFLDSPDRILTPDDASRETGLDLTSVSNVLRMFDNQNFIREIKQGHYQNIQALGDKVVSTKDLSRVSLEALNEYIIKEISKSKPNSDFTNLLETFHTELIRRGKNDIASKVLDLKGQLHMSQRPSDWVIEKINEFVNVSQPYASPAYTQPSPSAPISKSTSFSNRGYEPPSIPPSHVGAFQTSNWKDMKPPEILTECISQIRLLSTPKEAIELMNALREHLESSISGRILYQINSTINELKKANTLDKETLEYTLQELFDKL
jgi:hypothetical protein